MFLLQLLPFAVGAVAAPTLAAMAAGGSTKSCTACAAFAAPTAGATGPIAVTGMKCCFAATCGIPAAVAAAVSPAAISM